MTIRNDLRSPNLGQYGSLEVSEVALPPSFSMALNTLSAKMSAVNRRYFERERSKARDFPEYASADPVMPLRPDPEPA